MKHGKRRKCNADAVLEAVDLLYDAVFDPATWPSALHRASRVFEGTGALLFPVAPASRIRTIGSQDIAEACVAYEREWWRHDVRTQLNRARAFPGVATDLDLLTPEQMKRDPFYQEFLKPFDCDYFAAQVIGTSSDGPVMLSIQRDRGQGHFQKHELKTFALLARHATRAAAISAHISLQGQIETSLTGVLANVNCGVAIVRRDGTVHLMNEVLERQLGDGLVVRKGRLCSSQAMQQQRLDQLIASAFARNVDAHNAGPILLTRENAFKPLIVDIVAPSPRGTANSFFNSDRAVLLVIDPERNQQKSPARGLRNMGLAPAEARLAALVGSGLSPKEAAVQLGIREETARTALKRVYSKLNISRQSQLAQIVGQLALLR